jgi:chorismate mutase-like protein
VRWPIVVLIEFLSVITLRLLLFGLFWVLIAAFPASVTAGVDAPLNPLVTLMIQRLQLSREVAWNKCRAGIPVADPAREARMLTDLRSTGVQEGLSAAEVTRLFLPQIVASRRYQEELIAGWRSGIDIPRIEPLDLAAEIRPRLDKVNREMLRQWVKICRQPLDWADKEEARRMLMERGIPSDVAKIAVGPLGGPGPGSR